MNSEKMSFVFRGSRGDLESGFSGFLPERRAMVSFFLEISNAGNINS